MSLAVSGMIAYGYFMSKGGVRNKAASSAPPAPSPAGSLQQAEDAKAVIKVARAASSEQDPHNPEKSRHEA